MIFDISYFGQDINGVSYSSVQIISAVCSQLAKSLAPENDQGCALVSQEIVLRSPVDNVEMMRKVIEDAKGEQCHDERENNANKQFLPWLEHRQDTRRFYPHAFLPDPPIDFARRRAIRKVAYLWRVCTQWFGG